MNKHDYYRIRNMAWQLLLDCKIDKLPIDINILLRYCDTLAITHNFSDDTRGVFAISSRNEKIIFVNSNATDQQARFTIAHEIGHIQLEHKMEQSRIEKEANMFAARILMPIGVLHACHIQTSSELSEMCNVSSHAAEFRYKRYKMLLERNKFKTNVLENKLISNFSDFIESYNISKI